MEPVVFKCCINNPVDSKDSHQQFCRWYQTGGKVNTLEGRAAVWGDLRDWRNELAEISWNSANEKPCTRKGIICTVDTGWSPTGWKAALQVRTWWTTSWLQVSSDSLQQIKSTKYWAKTQTASQRKWLFSSLFGTCKTAYGVLCPTWSSHIQARHRYAGVSTADGHHNAPGAGAQKVPWEAQKAGLVQPAKERGSKGDLAFNYLRGRGEA